MDSLKFANLLLLLLLRLCKAEPHSLLGASSTRVKPDYRGFAQVSLRPGQVLSGISTPGSGGLINLIGPVYISLRRKVK